MKIIDVTGEIRNGMWTFGSLFPKVTIEERSGVCEGFGDYFYTEFVGMHTKNQIRRNRAARHDFRENNRSRRYGACGIKMHSLTAYPCPRLYSGELPAVLSSH